MYQGKLIFSQVMAHLPLHTFRLCVSRYQGDHYVKRFSCFDQYLVMAFAQFTHRESLRDTEACLRVHQSKLYHTGIRSLNIVRNTLSKANERRDWRIYADFAQIWIAISVYVLVAIIKKRLHLSSDLYTMLQILSLALFEKDPLEQMLANCEYKTEVCDMGNQLNLFNDLMGL